MSGSKRYNLLFVTGDANYPTLQTLDGIHSSLNLERWSIRSTLDHALDAKLLDSYRPDVVIFEPLHSKFEMTAELFKERNIPFISLGRRTSSEPVVWLDEYGAGRTTAHYLLERGFHQFALINFNVLGSVAERLRGFEETVHEAGCAASIGEGLDFSPWLESISTGNDKACLNWLRELPKPVGVFATDPLQAYGIIDAVGRSGLAVPESVAVIASCENPTICNMARVPVTALRIGYRSLGERAGALVRDWLEGGIFPVMDSMVPLGKIVDRASTAIIGASDPVVSKAAHWISVNLENEIRVDELSKISGVSRPVLEKRFRVTLGRSPLQEVHRQRIDRAKRMLRETPEPIGIVGQRCGIGDPYRFSTFFRKQTGYSPSAYRIGRW